MKYIIIKFCVTLTSELLNLTNNQFIRKNGHNQYRRTRAQRGGCVYGTSVQCHHGNRLTGRISQSLSANNSRLLSGPDLAARPRQNTSSLFCKSSAQWQQNAPLATVPMRFENP